VCLSRVHVRGRVEVGVNIGVHRSLTPDTFAGYKSARYDRNPFIAYGIWLIQAFPQLFLGLFYLLNVTGYSDRICSKVGNGCLKSAYSCCVLLHGVVNGLDLCGGCSRLCLGILMHSLKGFNLGVLRSKFFLKNIDLPLKVLSQFAYLFLNGWGRGFL